MELVSDVVNNQLYLYLPVALVLVGAILVFTFGFKSPEQPPFDKLSALSEDKKASTKKRKSKDKKVSVNGSAITVADKPTKEKQSPNKEAPATPKQAKSKEPEKRKVEVQKVTKSNTSDELKKNLKTKTTRRPVDYDEGTWETVPTKNDKKTKKQDSPGKKQPKTKKVESENVTKEDFNQNNEDNKENEEKITQEIVNKDVTKEDIPVVEEKKVKKDKNIKPKKEVIIPSPAIENEVMETASEEPMNDDAKQQNDITEVSVITDSDTKGGVAFDELGDVWTDPKAVKKSKKKSRRDN